MAQSPVWVWVLLYLVMINGLTYVAFFVDKRRAIRGEWRLRERTLLNLALIGGILGAKAGQYLLRHKSRKHSFVAELRVIMVLQGAVLLCAGVLFALPEGALEQGFAGRLAEMLPAPATESAATGATASETAEAEAQARPVITINRGL